MFTRFKQFLRRNDFNCFILALVFLSLSLRLSFHKARGGDMVGCFLLWFDEVEKNGGFSSLKGSFYIYPPMYVYHLVVASKFYGYLPKVFTEPQVLSIKLMSMFWDYVTAYFIYRLVEIKTGKASNLAKTAAVAFLFLPTVFLNSGLLGQCDIMYAAWVVAATYYFSKSNSFAGALCIGLAFAFKLQTVFVAPALLLFILLRKMPWYQLLLIPAVYFISILPAWVIGRPLSELLLIYPVQTILGNELTYYAANLYQWLPTQPFFMYERAGKIFGASLALAFVGFVYEKRPKLEADDVIQVILFSFILMPFVLPKMHERYFFVADILSFVLAFFRPRLFKLAVAQSFVSFVAYSEALQIKENFIPIKYVALIQGWVLYELAKDLFTRFSLMAEKKPIAL